MVDIREFLRHHVEGYLFNDIRTLANLKNEDSGALCYPLLMTAFAGVELMGALLSETTFNTHKGKDYFTDYWTKHLYPSDNKETAEALYSLVRNGIAHAYVLKGSIRVMTNCPEWHMKKDGEGHLYIDSIKIANRFIDSYESNILSIISSENSAVNGTTMSTRAREIINTYNTQAKRENTQNVPYGVLPIKAAYSHADSTIIRHNFKES